MPLNIKELIINSEIEDELTEDEFEQHVENEDEDSKVSDLEERFEVFKDEIIKECIDKIKEMINLSMEK